MADQEHLDILKQGVVAWNAWRDANFYEQPNLTQSHLDGYDLTDADLREADLTEAHLTEADLEGAYLERSILDRANLQRAKLQGANLSWANLQGANLEGANLEGANLDRVKLIGARLVEANLSGAYLCVVHLGEANLSGANLSGADLLGTDFSLAVLSGANVSGALLDLTVFASLDLSEVQGLETVIHNGPSTIGIDTVIKSKGKIPEAFLLGCGVPQSFIDYIPALINAMQPIQYYSCFISYSTKDDAFARRLHERMRAEQLRVWYAPEDIQGGKKIIDQLDRAIQLHDRLLLVLSEHEHAE